MTNNKFPNIFPYSQISIGMDRAMKQLEELSTTHTLSKYPPYNIIRNDVDKYKIELALAGFTKGDIVVEYYDSLLIIKSKLDMYKSNKVDSTDYLHHGISKRQFSKEFTLSVDIEIVNVVMENGMLFIDLERIVPESKKRRTIDIN
jgi:molecular chaperone IbpA